MKTISCKWCSRSLADGLPLPWYWFMQSPCRFQKCIVWISLTKWAVTFAKIQAASFLFLLDDTLVYVVKLLFSYFSRKIIFIACIILYKSQHNHIFCVVNYFSNLFVIFFVSTDAIFFIFSVSLVLDFS